MKNVDRRTVLAVFGSIGMLSLTGCLGESPGSSDADEDVGDDDSVDDEPVDFEARTIHVLSSRDSALPNGLGAHEEADQAARLFRSQEEANQLNEDYFDRHADQIDSDTIALIEEIDFDDSVLLVIEQRLPGSYRRLAADSVVRGDDGRLRAIVTAEQIAEGGDGAEYFDTLLMRIEINPDGIDEEATATIREPQYPDEPEVTITASSKRRG